MLRLRSSALARAMPDASTVTRHVFAETSIDGALEIQQPGWIGAGWACLRAGDGDSETRSGSREHADGNSSHAGCGTGVNPKLVVFGEDVGPKGGVHGATLGLQEKFGRTRVFDTSLSEEGIIGRAVGMALAGLAPVAEIQFRKYADPAAEQLNDCGTMRWRTHNRFAAPIVVRMPGGFFKCGDPWHSQTNEVAWIHGVGWRVAMPSNAEDAVGLLRAAMRGNDPTIFFEHRAMLDAAWARRPYPAMTTFCRSGRRGFYVKGPRSLSISWGAMVERCEQAAIASLVEVELIDLRTLSPWDRDAVIQSVQKTRRCLIVHEDTFTAGFGAEIAAVVAKEAFQHLDAPVERLTMPDIPNPHSPLLLEAAVPTAASITSAIRRIARASDACRTRSRFWRPPIRPRAPVRRCFAG